MDPWKASNLLISVVLFCICCALFYIFYSRVDQNSEGAREVRDLIRSAKDSIILNNSGSCEPVINSCEVVIKKEDPICNPNKLIEEVKKDFANPMASKSCMDVLEKMGKQCTIGCSLLLDTLISIPGEVTVDISYTDPETGKRVLLYPSMNIPQTSCTATAQRVVSLKADCG